MNLIILGLISAVSAAPSLADETQSRCDNMMVWDVPMQMCMPLPMPGPPPMKMTMAMIHGNAFGARIWEEGPRGRDAYAAPNMVMADIGTSLGDRHYLNLDFMGTAEKWTFPEAGYPLLLQIGEHNEEGVPFIDAQHPHSSPIMGLTLSDTIKLDTGDKDNLKLSFAPRGESTDGPIAFMHRPTGMANPDAPLGHHIGQDVGHISSTVLASSLRLGATIIEASAFNGTEPEPTKVDLPIGTPNSYAVRLIREFTPTVTAMASAAYVREPEHDDPSLPFVARFSASVYTENALNENWSLYNSLIFGNIRKLDHVESLSSFAEEFWIEGDRPRVFGRLEVLQRTAEQLAISEDNSPTWVVAATLGYSHALWKASGENGDFGELALGGSVTKDFLPAAFEGAYGGDPWTGKVFLQLKGMKMWDL